MSKRVTRGVMRPISLSVACRDAVREQRDLAVLWFAATGRAWANKAKGTPRKKDLLPAGSQRSFVDEVVAFVVKLRTAKERSDGQVRLRLTRREAAAALRWAILWAPETPLDFTYGQLGAKWAKLYPPDEHVSARTELAESLFWSLKPKHRPKMSIARARAVLKEWADPKTDHGRRFELGAHAAAANLRLSDTAKMRKGATTTESEEWAALRYDIISALPDFSQE